MALPKLVVKGYSKFTELHDIKELHTWLQQPSDCTFDSSHKQSLAMLLLSDWYLTHSDRKIRLMTSSCLAQLLRLCIPSQPFVNVENLETTLLFICGQLAQALQSGCSEERGLAVKLLECVISIRIFRLCSLISKGQQLLTSLLSLMLPIAESALAEEQTLVIQLIRSIMDDPLTMADCKVLMPLAETIVIGPHSSLARALVASGTDKYSGQMMSELLVWLIERCECKEKGEEVIPTSLQGLGVFRLAWELHLMSLQLVLPAYNVIAAKLKSLDVPVRVQCLKIVKNIILKDNVTKEHPLFSHFLDRFSDTNLGIRLHCLQATCQVLQVHPHLVPEMLEVLHQRTMDTELSVRCEVGAVCTLIMLKNSNSLELLPIVIKLANDKECQVSTEAVKGISRVYKQHLTNHAALNPSQKNAAHMIFNCVMSHYFSVETVLSRVVTQRLMTSFLLPNSMHGSERVEKLLFFLAEATPVAIRTYHAMLMDQMNHRNIILQWLQLDADTQRQEIESSLDLCSCLPETEDRTWVLNALVTGSEYDRNLMPSLVVLMRDNEMRQEDMDIIAEHAINTISLMYPGVPMHIYKLRRFILGLYKGMFNKHYIQSLMHLVHLCMVNPLMANKFGLDPNTIRMKTRNIAKAISVEAYTHVVYDTETLQSIINIIGIDTECAAAAFHFLATLGESKSFGVTNPELAQRLIELCEDCLFHMPQRKPTLNLVKAIVHFIHSSITPQMHISINNIFQLTRAELDMHDLCQRAPYIVLLGHLSAWLPVEQRAVLKATMARKVVKEMLMKSCSSTDSINHTQFWYPNEQLSAGVYCKVQGIRAMSRWITQAQSDDITTISNTFRMMDAFVTYKGDLLDDNTLSDKERAVLRLEAGACILKICRIQDAFKYLTASQIHNLCHLIMDDDACVREQFAHKVNKGLCLPAPHSLPIVFISILVLGVLEPKQHLQSKVINYIENFFCSSANASTWPQYCMYWTLPLLACTPCRWLLPSLENVMGAWPIQCGITAFSRIRVALWSLLRPLIALQPHVSVARLEKIVQMVKNCKDTVPADTFSNQRLWSTCDVALNLLDVYKMTSLRKSSKTPDVTELEVKPADYNLLCANMDPNYVNTANFANVMFGPLPQVSLATQIGLESPYDELDRIFKP